MFKRDGDTDPLIKDLQRYAGGQWHVVRAAMSRSNIDETGAIPLTELVKRIDEILEEDRILRKRFRGNDF